LLHDGKRRLRSPPTLDLRGLAGEKGLLTKNFSISSRKRFGNPVAFSNSPIHSCQLGMSMEARVLLPALVAFLAHIDDTKCPAR
jgi:hypothetical protein